MLAPAKTDFEPDRIDWRACEGGFRVGGLFGVQAEPWQRFVEEALLPGTQRVPALAAVKPLRLGLERSVRQLGTSAVEGTVQRADQIGLLPREVVQHRIGHATEMAIG